MTNVLRPFPGRAAGGGGERPRPDDEREVVVATLERAVTAGRMTEAEYRRVAQQLLGAPSHLAGRRAAADPRADEAVESGESGDAPPRGAVAGAGDELPGDGDRRRTERALRRGLFRGQLDQAEYLRRVHLSRAAASRRQLADLVADLDAVGAGRQRLVSLAGAVLVTGTVALLIVDFLLLALGIRPGLALVVPTAAVWGLSVLFALWWLPVGRRTAGGSVPVAVPGSGTAP